MTPWASWAASGVWLSHANEVHWQAYGTIWHHKSSNTKLVSRCLHASKWPTKSSCQNHPVVSSLTTINSTSTWFYLVPLHVTPLFSFHVTPHTSYVTPVASFHVTYPVLSMWFCPSKWLHLLFCIAESSPLFPGSRRLKIDISPDILYDSLHLPLTPHIPTTVEIPSNTRALGAYCICPISILNWHLHGI